MRFLENFTQTLKWSIIIVLLLSIWPATAWAISDPLAVPNNKVGIHLIDDIDKEASEAASLVDSSGGDWGYVTIIIKASDRNHDQWQTFFDDLRRRHLIPLVRIATEPQGDIWRVPGEEEAQNWADFFDNLNWPTRNRYVIVYNEPNQGHEWGGKIDAKSYAVILEKFILTLKRRNGDYFVLNAGFDASAPETQPSFEDEQKYLIEMNTEVPEIFNSLDGWVSHSYPNPGFVGSPYSSGRGTINNWKWELSVLRSLGVTKSLPVFITETGWKHAEGIKYDGTLPSSDTVAGYYQTAFQDPWNDPRIVAVTPFLLNYQEAPFDHFSFKKFTGEKQNTKILGIQYPDNPLFYSIYGSLAALPKTAGLPLQINSALLSSDEIFSSIVTGQNYQMKLTFKNTGQAIWGDKSPFKLLVSSGGSDLGLNIVNNSPNTKVQPGGSYTFLINVKAPQIGNYPFQLALFDGSTQVETTDLTYQVAVKSPVVLTLTSNLKWKKDSSGDYSLGVKSSTVESQKLVQEGKDGVSGEIQAVDLLPDYSFDFTLNRPFYYSKTIHQTVHSGENSLDFGELQPNFFSALLHPLQLWKLLPFSN